MSRRVPPKVNASLIREGRMIFNQLSQIFGNSDKVDNIYAMKAAQAKAEADIAKAKHKPMMLRCARCIKLKNTPIHEAVTIYNGNALCDSHTIVAMSTTAPHD